MCLHQSNKVLAHWLTYAAEVWSYSHGPVVCLGGLAVKCLQVQCTWCYWHTPELNP